MSDSEPEVVIQPWYAHKDVPVLAYRINRRPRAEVPMWSAPSNSFIDHLVRVLPFGGEPVVTGKRNQRSWKLGNSHIARNESYVAGVVGWVGADTHGEERYDDATKSWTTDVVEDERAASAPFVIIVDGRFLFVAKHATFAEGTLPGVFESLLNMGEAADPEYPPTTQWAVEPVLDSQAFNSWLADIAVLDKVEFHVKLPNPDSSQYFQQIADHLRNLEASEVSHSAKPRDPDRGLNKDLMSDSLARGFLEMVQLAYGWVRAVGRGPRGQRREYDQKLRVRKRRVRFPDTSDAARATLIDHALSQARQILPEEELDANTTT